MPGETKRSARGAFSLIELVIVVVIIGVIAAIAVPRISRGSVGSLNLALARDLTVMRKAIDLYEGEHQALPASHVGATAADFERQLRRYTNANGASNAAATQDASHPFGPYLRRIPPLPVGSRKGSTSVRIGLDGDAPGIGRDAWIYYPRTGEIKANLPAEEVDARKVPYNQY